MTLSPTLYRSDLRPLPIRITQLQFDRLEAIRNRDGIAMQEHIRRAIDLYLPVWTVRSSLPKRYCKNPNWASAAFPWLTVLQPPN